MGTKLILVRYLGFNPDGELCTVGRLYPYYVETKKQIKPQEFVVLADKSQNDDRNVVSTVRVIKVLDNPSTTVEDVEKLTAECEYRNPRKKLFVGKADLGGFFAELDKKRKREEITKKLEERFKEAEKMALYQKLAETDPEMKALLTELEELK